jgi:AcrR family transcriptional regulator
MPFAAAEPVERACYDDAAVDEPDEAAPCADPTTEAILATATELVVASGFHGFSMDAVAKQARVSKATIYRRWPSRDDLVLDVYAQLRAPVRSPDTGDVLEDLRIILSDLCALLDSPLSPVMAALADGAERDEALDDLMRTVGSRSRAHLIRALSDGIERGELAAATEPHQLADLLVGPLFYRRFFRRVGVDPRQAIEEAEDLLSRHATG